MPSNLLEEVITGKEKPTVRHFTEPLAIIISSFGGGYAIAHFPPKFLKLLYSPLGQFFVFYILVYLTYKGDSDITQKEMILEAILYVIIVQVAKVVLDWIFK